MDLQFDSTEYNYTISMENPNEIGFYPVQVTLYDEASNMIAKNSTDIEIRDENIRKDEITDDHRSIALGILSYMNMIKRKVEK